MTAIDAAVQARLLGAEQVSIVYRRGPDDMPASAAERHWAQTRGVHLRHWAAPTALLGDAGGLRGVRFAATTLQEGRLTETGEHFELEADMVLRAIGQAFVAAPLAEPDAPAEGAIALCAGRIATDAEGRTGHARVWAGGDCRHGGRDLTVEAVEHGKRAAASIDRMLRAGAGQESGHG